MSAPRAAKKATVMANIREKAEESISDAVRLQEALLKLMDGWVVEQKALPELGFGVGALPDLANLQGMQFLNSDPRYINLTGHIELWTSCDD